MSPPYVTEVEQVLGGVPVTGEQVGDAQQPVASGTDEVVEVAGAAG
jgi:hypothetical protein